MSNFTAKRRNAGRPASKVTAVELAKRYAECFGYEMRGGMVYGPDGERVCRGWTAFAAKLEQENAIEPGRGLRHRFAVGDRLAYTSVEGRTFPPFTVERAEYIGIEPIYYYTDEHGHRTYSLDYRCARA